MKNTIGGRTRRGANSVMNRAIPMLTGTAITMAMSELSRVP